MEKCEDILKLEQNKNIQQSRSIPNASANIFMKSEDRQDFNPINVTNIPNPLIDNGDAFSKLMNTKMVRIRLNSKCACVKEGRKNFYIINTISKIDDINPENENELPLFEIEEHVGCFLSQCCEPEGVKFDVFESMTKQLNAVIETRQNITKIQECCCCCGENYDVYPPIYNYKCVNPNDISTVKQYD